MSTAVRALVPDHEDEQPRPEAAVVVLPVGARVESRNQELIEQYHRTRDREVLDAILRDNQGLLHSVLRRFSYFPDPYEDLLQVANLGLIKAVQRFDSSRGLQFSSYATAIVDGEVRHYLRDNVLMRQPRWLKKAEKNIEMASIDLTRRLKRRPTVSEVAAEVNISEEGVLEILKHSAAAGVHAIDDALNREDMNQALQRDAVKSQHYESFNLPIEDRIMLEEALDALSALHKRIVYLLFYKDLTQTEVAKELGLSQRKVSRESAKALGRMKAILNTRIF